ncbi:acyltransferase family protein [Pseudoduganella ginsengisoli]|uniref:Acyltransferase family protein n=1 Tax=Pseudoduganella ginsengisoli TaxID=1462440 RepID=A0A6L6PW46_9BURK|nr:acyltransferase family protein [Pseudoduganella ginsengisoli]MTW01456.1 acyltransferase family protein [Pseudoduganella ginsengisoli]
MHSSQQRLYFLDWIRIAAFFLLVLYHTGMYYVNWDWHVKSPHASDTIEAFMMLSSPWRMSLLFLVSGVAAAFLLNKAGAGAFARQRSVRLLVPLVFGMLVIVPPQPYFEVVEKVAYQGSYLDFMKLYVNAYHGFCRGTDCLTLPTWNHLWFLPYLWVYCLLLAALAAVLGRPRWQQLGTSVANAMSGWKLVVLPVAILAIGRLALLNKFPHTNNLVWDWHNHATYFPIFMLGAMVAFHGALWQRMENIRFGALGTALGGWAFLMSYYAITDQMPPGQIGLWQDAQRVLYALVQWSAILAVCGFGHRHLQFDSAKRRYLTEAVFPVYILHQTLIIVFSQLIKPAHHGPVLEAVLLIVMTLSASFGIFEVVRRIPLLRPLFGLGRAARPVQAVPAATQAAA